MFNATQMGFRSVEPNKKKKGKKERLNQTRFTSMPSRAPNIYPFKEYVLRALSTRLVAVDGLWLSRITVFTKKKITLRNVEEGKIDNETVWRPRYIHGPS